MDAWAKTGSMIVPTRNFSHHEGGLNRQVDPV
jgi:hypothetical protein